MKVEVKTILDATRYWVMQMNAFPLNMIQKLFESDIDSWNEVTPISEGCRVWSNDYCEGGEVTEIKKDENENEIIVVELDNGEEVETTRNDLSREDDTYFPMWGTMWNFGESADDWWLEEHLEEMAECGFRIYEHDEWGYFFGIDGAGYDFYEAHWIPLYKARGLRWHDEPETKE